MARQFCFITMFIVLFVLAGCQSRHEIEVKPVAVEVKPIEIKPIHITIDVNVKVDRALDDFFDDIDAAEDKIKKE